MLRRSLGTKDTFVKYIGKTDKMQDLYFTYLSLASISHLLLSQIKISLPNLLGVHKASKGLHHAISLLRKENHEGTTVFTSKIKYTKPHEITTFIVSGSLGADYESVIAIHHCTA